MGNSYRLTKLRRGRGVRDSQTHPSDAPQFPRSLSLFEGFMWPGERTTLCWVRQKFQECIGTKVCYDLTEWASRSWGLTSVSVRRRVSVEARWEHWGLPPGWFPSSAPLLSLRTKHDFRFGAFSGWLVSLVAEVGSALRKFDTWNLR